MQFYMHVIKRKLEYENAKEHCIYDIMSDAYAYIIFGYAVYVWKGEYKDYLLESVTKKCHFK